MHPQWEDHAEGIHDTRSFDNLSVLLKIMIKKTCFSLGVIFEVFPTNTVQALQQHSNTASPYLAGTRRQQKANLISRCQSEPLAVRSLGLLWIRGFDVGLLRDRAAARQPLGSSPARPRCACDSPGPRLPEGLFALWENRHVQHPHGQSSSSLPGSDDC